MTKRKPESPVREYRTIVRDSGDPGYVNRLLIGTPTTGLVRIEWVSARYGQIIPVNWSHVQILQFMDSFIPVQYQVADAQNIIVNEAVTKDFEWLLLIEHDTLPPADAFVRMNRHIKEEKVPVISGLYYTKSNPADPLVFRGRGTGAYDQFKLGDMVWCDGVPTGFLLIHVAILREMWKESAEYILPRGQVVRRVFDTPRKLWMDPEFANYNAVSGTSDLEWCTRVMQGGYFKKAGWPEYQKKKYPFLVDTNIFCMHIDQNGIQYPAGGQA